VKQDQPNIDLVKTSFAKMESKEDFLALLNLAKPMIYGEKAIPFQMKQITWYSNPNAGGKRYITFKIKKKSGADRLINAPVKGLKVLQRTLCFILQCVFEPHEAATGFVLNKSIVDNARPHEGSLYVFNIDLKDFFSSIDQARVWKCLQLRPFNLNCNKNYRLSLKDVKAHRKNQKSIIFNQDGRLKIANMIAAICCTELEVERKNETGEWITIKRNVLPQGAPTSPLFTNVVCQRLDYLLTGVAKRFGLKYTRYADDITFSSMINIFNTEGEFLKELHRIISEQGFFINDKKTRLQKDGYRKEVTGLLVNSKVNVQKRYIKQLRMWLYYWERYGYDRAYGFYLQHHSLEKGHSPHGKPNLINVIHGKLNYLKMVKGSNNELYLKLKNRFDILIKPSIVAISAPEVEKLPIQISHQKQIISKISEDKNARVTSKNLLPHDPVQTVVFLKKFKIGDGSGFKELVHDVILTEEIIKDILEKVKNYPTFINHFKNEKVSQVSFLNKNIYFEVIKLITLFEEEGVPFFKHTNKHPFNNDSTYTELAKDFKRKYRYGSGSEYSKLQNDIIKIFEDQKVRKEWLKFLPDERKFSIRASFFTWQPSIYYGLRHIIQGISEHTNINGQHSFSSSEKEISVEVEKMQSDNSSWIELRIFDMNSVVEIECDTLLEFLKGSNTYKFDFRNLCDWIIECDFLDDSSKRLNLLISKNTSENLKEIESLNYRIGGYKHILKFYDVK